MTDIETIIMAYAPLLIMIMSVITAFVKMVKMIKNNQTFSEEMKTQLKEVIDQNYILKTKLNELMTTIDKIKRGE